MKTFQTAKFWQDASTIMALIREGYTGLREIGDIMGKPRSTVHYLVRRLVALGFVTQNPGKRNTLRLTNPDTVSLIRLAHRRPDGVVQKFPGRKEPLWKPET